MKLIIDGDFGGDEMQLMAVAMAHHQKFTILGFTTVFGNTSGTQVTQNALALSTFLNASHIPVYVGHENPIDSEMLKGDGAHGSDGLGDVELVLSSTNQQSQHAVDFINQTLLDNPEKTISITATGPLTNIADVIRKNPEAMARVKNIVIMGGATEQMRAMDIPYRKGNITPNAEFNFYQDAKAAEEVLKSGLPIILHPMNCTHDLTLTPAFEKDLYQALSVIDCDKAQKIGVIMAAPRALDKMKFGIHPVMHDVNTILYMIHPEAYLTEEIAIEVTSEGECITATDKRSPITVARKIIDTRLLHNEVIRSFQFALS